MILINYIRLTRPLNGVISFISILLAIYIAGGVSISLINYIIAATAGMLTGAAGNVINDFFDVEIDKINRPDRMIASGKISKTSALKFYLMLIVAALILSLSLNVEAFIVVAVASIFIFFYSSKWKRLPLIGNVVVSSVTGFAFIYGGIVVGNILPTIFPALFAFMTTLIREIVKDIQDIEGDKARELKTFPISYGEKKSIKLINILTLILILMTTFPFFLSLYKIEFLVFVMMIVNPLLIRTVKMLSVAKTSNDFYKVSSLIKIVMILGIIGIILGI
ncbi:MAG: geranylgeranylglycerol-phosphate geranylgeranyltransferase [Ignavibacteriaceae bacterium]|nr:geranylgeranylglycerol-phosphate geranylgeranyltransferase [Ignavibacteriaceae bacterium]